MARPRYSFSEDYRRPQAQARGCDEPGCDGVGEFRAPRSRDRLGVAENYIWLCLDHVRAYNAAWNYYSGMSESEIEADLRKDTVWQRPTWPLGWRPGIFLRFGHGGGRHQSSEVSDAPETRFAAWLRMGCWSEPIREQRPAEARRAIKVPLRYHQDRG